jgi:hypothetical protein
VALCSLVVLSAGCGPFGYIKKVARESSRAVAKAESSGAEENAPYEYWGSVTYLEQSKILMGYSEYERSFDYGERAKQLAEEATKKAEMRRKGRWSRAATLSPRQISPWLKVRRLATRARLAAPAVVRSRPASRSEVASESA